MTAINNQNVHTPIVNVIQQSENPQPFKCPGHSDFFHHFAIYDNAKQQANEAVLKLQDDSSIKEAHFTLIHKDTIEGQESGFFSNLHALYKYAVVLNYTHVDDALNCPHNPMNAKIA